MHGRFGQVAQIRQVHSRIFAQVLEVHVLDFIAIHHTVFGAQILVLVLKILVHFGDPHGGKSPVHKRRVVAAAQVAVVAVNHPYFQVIHVPLTYLLHVTGQGTRLAIIFEPVLSH